MPENSAISGILALRSLRVFLKLKMQRIKILGRFKK